MKPTRTWVLIADAGHARVLQNDGPGRGLHPVPALTLETELPRTHDLVDDRQPRAYESVGSARHAISAGADPHRKEKRRFAHQIADALDKGLLLKAYERLIIVAPAQALGDIRAGLSERVRVTVVHEVAKDLVKTPDHEIAGHLGPGVAL